MKKIKNIISKVFLGFADCITPTIPILVGVGMLKVLLIILGPTVLNVLSETMPTYTILSFVADAGYYFMPIYAAISTAEYMKTNKYIAAVIGGMLLSPAFVELVNNNVSLTFIKIPIASTNYGNQVLPSVIAIVIMSYLYKLLDKFIKGTFNSLLVPMLTIIIMIPVSFGLIGPIGVYLSDKLVDVILWLCNLGPIGNGIMCAIIPFITIAGLGGANLSAMLILAASGCDPILFYANVIYNNVLGFVTLSLYLKNKNPDTLAAAITSAVGGSSEAAIFGVVMKDFKAMMALCAGCFTGGLYAGVMGVKSFAMASFGTFGIITTIGPGSSIVHAAIAMIIGCIVGFVVSFVIHKHE